MSARNCVTHHHACDCREDKFLRIEKALEKAVLALKACCYCAEKRVVACNSCIITIAEIESLFVKEEKWTEQEDR